MGLKEKIIVGGSIIGALALNSCNKSDDGGPTKAEIEQEQYDKGHTNSSLSIKNSSDKMLNTVSLILDDVFVSGYGDTTINDIRYFKEQKNDVLNFSIEVANTIGYIESRVQNNLKDTRNISINQGSGAAVSVETKVFDSGKNIDRVGYFNTPKIKEVEEAIEDANIVEAKTSAIDNLVK